MNLGTLDVEDTPATRALFPEITPRNGYLTLEYTPRTTIPLRAIGYDKIQPSIGLTYNWCNSTPFEVQVKTCELMTEHPRCFVLNSMGTGKTRCALWSFDYLKKLGLVNKMLVVCPLSTMTFTWVAEILKVTPHLRWAVLHGTAEQRRKLLASVETDIYIINHDGVKVIARELEQRPDVDVMCLDELAVYRNPVQRTRLIARLCKDKAVVWGMTGAPMPNFVTDIYNQIKIILPSRVPRHFSWFRDELQVRISQFKWANKPGAIEKAFGYMQPSVRYTLDDITELPEAYVPPPQQTEIEPEQKRAYDELRKYAGTLIKNGQVNAVNAGVLMSKLLQVSAGWVYDSKREVHHLGGAPRLDALADIIAGADGKTIVFAPYRHTLAGIVEHLTKEGYQPLVVHGDTPPKERNKLFNTFQNNLIDKNPLVVYPRCISHGLTLTAANTAVWFGPILSAETYEQCNARIRRVGQKRKQLFVHLWSTPMERKVYDLLTKRLLQQDTFLHLLEEASWD
jgi:SNF2 family DNA or RNA helicase